MTTSRSKASNPFKNLPTVRTEAYYEPEPDIRLFRPQTYLMENEKGHLTLDWLSVQLCTASGINLEFPYQPGNNLPLMLTDKHLQSADPTCQALLNLNQPDRAYNVQQLIDENNHNLAKPQKELLLLHYRLAHAGFGWIQDLMRKRKQNLGDRADPAVLPVSSMTSTATCSRPKCPSCQLAKQHRRTPDTTTTHKHPKSEMAIRWQNLKPGECMRFTFG